MATEKEIITADKKEKVVDLNLYKIKKSLRSEGFEVVTDEKGKLKLVLRLHEV